MNPHERPSVSVVMATYNGADFIEAQVRSILAQTLPPTEIVIGDDGSTDGTLEILERVAADTEIPILVVVNDERLGYGPNFLAAADRATGAHVAFSDQDDLWHPTKIERSLQALQQPGVVLVGHQMNLVDDEGRFLRLDLHGTRRTVRFEPGRADPFGVFFGFTMTFDRRLLDVLPVDGRGADSFRPAMALAHDRWVFLLGTTFGSAELLAEPLADYRQHAAQAFGVIPRTRLERIRHKLHEGPARIEALKTIARHRRGLIERARPVGPVPADALVSMQQWEVAARRWRRVSTYSDRRATSYASPSFVRRFGAWTINTATGAYRSHRHGGLGRMHILEDLAAGVAGALMRRLVGAGGA